MIQHNNYLLVPVPKERTEIFLCEWGKNCQSISVGIHEKEIHLPPGSYSIIGLGDSLSREQKREIVESYNDGGLFCRDYSCESPVFGINEDESFKSLLASHTLQADGVVVLKIN